MVTPATTHPDGLAPALYAARLAEERAATRLWQQLADTHAARCEDRERAVLVYQRRARRLRTALRRSRANYLVAGIALGTLVGALLTWLALGVH